MRIQTGIKNKNNVIIKRVKLKRVATFTKKLRKKKLEIKTKRTKLKNIIPSI
jgi:hypothetical protein